MSHTLSSVHQSSVDHDLLVTSVLQYPTRRRRPGACLSHWLRWMRKLVSRAQPHANSAEGRGDVYVPIISSRYLLQPEDGPD